MRQEVKVTLTLDVDSNLDKGSIASLIRKAINHTIDKEVILLRSVDVKEEYEIYSKGDRKNIFKTVWDEKLY